MADKHITNYPDVLGYLTGSERYNVGVVQAALATRPRIVQAGRPFEVILLLQNASDSPIDVTCTLNVPEKDANGQRKRFISKKARLVVGVEAAEVGYVTLPVSSMPDTAVGNDYKVDVEIGVKVLEKKPARVRLADGGGRFNPNKVAKETRDALESLRKLRFTTETRRGLIRSGGLEASFGILEGKLGKPLDLTPGWVSLWSLANQEDTEPLIEEFGDLLVRKVLPSLKREKLYPPLLAKTQEVFEEAGYPLKKIEAESVARLMTLILEFAFSGDLAAQGGSAAGLYNVQATLSTKRLPGDDRERPIPRWTIAFLQAMAKDIRVARVPDRVIPAYIFEPLLFDALMYSFAIVERDSGEDLGSLEEMQDYAEIVLSKLGKDGGMNFSYAYLPLVIGGVISTDMMLMAGERLVDVMREMVTMIEQRQGELDDSNEPIFFMMQHILDLTLRKYGILDSGR